MPDIDLLELNCELEPETLQISHLVALIAGNPDQITIHDGKKEVVINSQTLYRKEWVWTLPVFTEKKAEEYRAAGLQPWIINRTHYYPGRYLIAFLYGNARALHRLEWLRRGIPEQPE